MTTRARPFGQGTIEWRGGTCRARVVVDGKYKDLAICNSEPEAESVLRGYAMLAARGEVITGGETLRDYGRHFLDQRELAGARNGPTDRSRWELHVMNAPFADQPVQSIGRRDIKDWLVRLRAVRASDKRGERGISAQTIKHCLTLLRACLQAALDDEIIAVNPASKIKGPAVRRDDGWTYLVPDEQRAMLTCASIPEPERMLLAFAIGTGMREGELWNLELPDLVAWGPHPHVMVRYGKPGHQPTKSGKIRRVPLFGLALAGARRWLELLPTYAKKNPFGLAFPTARGCRRRDSKPPRHWKAYLKSAGLGDGARRHDGRPVRFHDLRHTCASSLVAGWWGRAWRLEEVRDVLGHTSITVTERYAHLAPGVLAQAAAATVPELPFAAPNTERKAEQPTVPQAVPRQLPPPETLPKLSPLGSDDFSGEASKTARATQDSNLRPSAPEAEALLNDSGHLALLRGARGENLVPMAERYLRAVSNRNRFAHRYGVELAQATIATFPSAVGRPDPSELAERDTKPAKVVELAPATGELEQLELPFVASPAPARPGLARARGARVELDDERLVAGDERVRR